MFPSAPRGRQAGGRAAGVSGSWREGMHAIGWGNFLGEVALTCWVVAARPADQIAQN
jgi:hypothetical protein